MEGTTTTGPNASAPTLADEDDDREDLEHQRQLEDKYNLSP